MDYIENKMDEFAYTINNLFDVHNENVDEHAWIKAKLADLEDRSRRTNLKIREIFESIQQSLLPDIPESESIIDRIHCIPKSSFILEHMPRDVLMCIHLFNVNEQLIIKTHNAGSLPSPYMNLQFFADFS